VTSIPTSQYKDMFVKDFKLTLEMFKLGPLGNNDFVK
jgi:hypothetical protein